MACQFCHRNIGLLRRFRDTNFCSAEHRDKYRANSARALRESEDLYGRDDEGSARTPQKAASHGSQSGFFLAAIAIAVVLLGVTRGAGDGPAPSVRSEPDPASAHSPGEFRRDIGEAIAKCAPVTIREAFNSGLAKWDSPPRTKTSDWTFDGSYMRPGSLRLWKLRHDELAAGEVHAGVGQ